MTTTDFILKELCNVIDFDKHYASLDDVQMTVSMPQIIELVNKALKQERETILKYANSNEFNRRKGENSPYAFELTKWIEKRGNT